MNHLVVLPVVIPALTAALLLLLHAAPMRTARTMSGLATLGMLVVAAVLTLQAAQVPQTYALGDWPAPFGIVLVADRLSTLMVALTSLLALVVVIYAAHGWDARGRFFHPLFHFQLMGLNGAFLTGDLFNLFVFFEVMLIASYGLMLQGLGAARLRATFHYVTINLTGSGVFLIGVALLYGVTGTLNMAHLAERVAAAHSDDVALIRVAGLLLIGVFCVKGALFPLYFWLPAAYSNAAPPVAALFAIMTKVGVYSIIRVTTLIYGVDAGAAADLTTPWLMPLALVTFALAALGVVGAERLGGLVAYLTVGSVGTMLTAVAIGGVPGLSAALYYIVHSTLVVALLFLLVDLLERQRGERGDHLHPGPALRRAGWLGFAFLVGGIVAVGLPPSSGFLAKLMVLRSAEGIAGFAWVWLVLLVGTGVILIGCARAGSMLFWNVTERPGERVSTPRVGEWLAVAVLIAASAAIVLLAAPLKGYLDVTAAQLTRPRMYVDHVLGARVEPLTQPLPARGRP